MAASVHASADFAKLRNAGSQQKALVPSFWRPQWPTLFQHSAGVSGRAALGQIL